MERFTISSFENMEKVYFHFYEHSHFEETAMMTRSRGWAWFSETVSFNIICGNYYGLREREGFG